MSVRVTIECIGDPTEEHEAATTAKGEFCHPLTTPCDAYTLGRLIGYAVNAVEAFFIPGNVLAGIRDVLNVQSGDAGDPEQKAEDGKIQSSGQ